MQAGEDSVQALMSEVFQCLLDDAVSNLLLPSAYCLPKSLTHCPNIYINRVVSLKQREARRSGPNGDSPMSEGSCDVRLLIHQSQAGAVIGRSGSKVKELREVLPVFTFWFTSASSLSQLLFPLVYRLCFTIGLCIRRRAGCATWRCSRTRAPTRLTAWCNWSATQPNAPRPSWPFSTFSRSVTLRTVLNVALVVPLDTSKSIKASLASWLKEAPPKGPVNNYNPASISAPEITYGGWNGGMVGGAPPSQFPMDSNYGGGAPRYCNWDLTILLL